MLLHSNHINVHLISFTCTGIQHFKSPKFVAEQGRVEDMFIQLPPPKPSRTQYQNQYNYGGYGSSAASAAPAQPVAMTSYYNVGGGCYSADSFVYGVSTSGGKVLIRASALQKGRRHTH